MASLFVSFLVDFLLQFHLFKSGTLFAFESLLMFMIYTILPVVVESTSAAFLNLNLLSSDFFTAIYGFVFKNYKVFRN